MAGAFGADQRLVAFMQYYRVIMVTAFAALIARVWVGGAGSAPDVVWFPPIAWPAFASTLGVAAAGLVLGKLLRLPTPAFMGPMLLAVSLKLSGFIELQLPEWLLAASYAVIGWTVGLRFRRETVLHVRRVLPQITLAILALIAFCGVLAFLLWEFAGVDPLTAYLATSPGGMDAVAIIAAASGDVDLSFIMVLQMLRFILVLLLGPAIARMVALRIRT
jgi:membrane AbrB-like protein